MTNHYEILIDFGDVSQLHHTHQEDFMGTCKDAMTPSTARGKSLMDRIRGKKNKKTPEKGAENLVDKLAEMQETLDSLIQTKQAELKAEKGQEEKNRRSLSLLVTMQFHLDQVIDNAAEYGNS